jgi:uncharacterized heparinase superfamily protein
MTESPMRLHELARLIRTVRHLRPSQIYWRGRYSVRRKLSRALGVPTWATASTNGAISQLQTDLPASIAASDEASPDGSLITQLSQGTFQLLNAARALGRPPDWLLGQTDHDRLWTVTLHYHRWAYDLAQLASREEQGGREAGELFVEYLSDWMDRCDLSAPGAIHLAWNAYATATRISWWVRSALLLGPEWWSRRADFRGRFLSSLSRQADYLARNIEWDLRGNHLLRDAVGLAWAGRFLNSPQAAQWLRSARVLAADQVREQILGDGGHFERSPMYHRIVMDDLLVLSRLIDEPTVRHEIETTLCRMVDFAHWVRHPDGKIPLVNDAALESKPAFDKVPTACGGRHFAETGLAIWHGTPWTVFFDVGPIGPDYQPGHGHADTLSLECSYDGLRLFVDPGTHSYDPDERRAYDRSTAAHNTICVDGTDSSEVWDIFRVGRRARPFSVDVRAAESVFDATAAHDGYFHLRSVVHRRRVQVADGSPLIIIDRIEGQGRHRVEGGWLLEPGWAVSPSARGWELRQGRRTVYVILDGPAELRRSLETRPWHPQFGVEMATSRLVWKWEGVLPLETKSIVEPRSAGG